MGWTLLYKGAEKTLADWGLNHLSRSLVSQNRDIVSFDADGTQFDADHLFDYRSTVTIKKDGVQWFVGTVVKIPRQGAARSEKLTYQLAGPWYFLDQLEFKQTWSFYVGKIKNTNFYTTHLLLNNNNGLLISTRDQILAVLNYALAQALADPTFQSTPFQIGSVLAGTALFPAIDEVRDLTCAECLRKELRWHPDAVTWFDYSTTPPTFNIAQRSKLAAANLQIPTSMTLAAGVSPKVSEASVTPRYDLQRPSVAIQYEIRTTVDSQDYLSIVTDIAPNGATGREVGALTATIDLQGAKFTTLKASMRVDPINTADINWWTRKFVELADSHVKNLVFTPGFNIARSLRNPDGTLSATNPATALPNEVIEGQVCSWMSSGGVVASGQQEELAAYFTYDLFDDDGVTQRKGKEEQLKSHKCVTTNMPSGDYQTLGSVTAGDPQPVGLAAFLYNALSVLQYEGSVKLGEQECSGAALIGNTINLLGGRAEWAAMNALIQQVNEQVDQGATTISFGPAEQLGPSDIVELLRVNRYRVRITPPDVQNSATLGSSGNSVQFGKQTANANGLHGENLENFLTIKSQPPGSPAPAPVLLTQDAKSGVVNFQQDKNQVNITLTQCNGKKLYVREFAVCVLNADGTQSAKKSLLIGSDPY